MTLHIGRMRLRLPAGYAGRAESIARAIAQATAGIGAREARTLDTLAVGPIRVDAGASDAQIAAAAAQQLQRQLENAS